MQTCPNCRYELRSGQTACPMCGTALERPAKRGGARFVVLLGVIAGIVAIGVVAAASRGGRDTAGGPAASRSPVAAASCKPVPSEEPASKATYQEAPSEQLDPNRKYTLVLDTSCGEIDVALDVRRAPKTTSSVAFLTREGYYDGLTFHRVEPGFVIQGGDPSGNGTGGPGYTVVEAPPSDLKYTEGVMAMAKRADEPSGASGSQFFIVSGPRAANLPAQYALVGTVTSGMDVVAAIERAFASGAPPIIERATVRSS